MLKYCLLSPTSVPYVWLFLHHQYGWILPLLLQLKCHLFQEVFLEGSLLPEFPHIYNTIMNYIKECILSGTTGLLCCCVGAEQPARMKN